MSLREKFIAYCELQRNARNYREIKGAEHKDTKLAYEKANEKKRQVLEGIQRLEDENKKLRKELIRLGIEIFDGVNDD